jgi:putative nucleotidyltransferase with HDIG domain
MKTIPRLPGRFYWFVCCIWLLALAAVYDDLWLHPVVLATDRQGVLVALALIIFVALAGAMPLTLSPMTKIHVGTAPLFAATLLFPVPVAVCIAVIGTVAYHAYLQAGRRRVWQDTAFNTGRVMLQVAVAGSVFHALAPGQGWVALVYAPSLTLAAVLSALTFYVINLMAVHSATALITGQNPLRLWWTTLHVDGLQQAMLLLFGVVTALIIGLFPILGLAMVFPVAVVYWSLRQSQTLHAHTQSAIEAIADAVDLRAFGAVGHSQRVADLAARLAVRLGLSRGDVELVRRAARVHDIGKVGFSDAALRQDRGVSNEEIAALQRHPAYGAEILAPFAEYQRCRHFVRLHHEQPDGAGFPEGQRDSQIPLGAAIISVAESFDAFTNERPYRAAIAAASACSRLLAGGGTRWNATVVQGLMDEVQTKSPEWHGTAAPKTAEARS